MRISIGSIMILLGMLLTFVFSGSLQGEDQSQEEPTEADLLSRKVESFLLQELAIDEAVAELRQLGFRVCLENVHKQKMSQFSISLQDKSLKEILESVVAEDTNYTWEKPNNMDIIIIYPKAGSILKWKIPVLRVKKMPIIDLLGKEDILGLKKHGIIFFYRGFRRPVEAQVSIDLKDSTVMECLNSLVSQVPRLCWTITESPHGKRVLSIIFAGLGNEDDVKE